MSYIGVHKITNNLRKSTFPNWNREYVKEIFFNTLKKNNGYKNETHNCKYFACT